MKTPKNYANLNVTEPKNYKVKGLTARDTNIQGYEVTSSKKANYDNVKRPPMEQLVDETMSDNATVKTITKGATVNHPV